MLVVLIVGIDVVVLLWSCSVVDTFRSVLRAVTTNRMSLRYETSISLWVLFKLAMENNLVAFDFPPAACVATITGAIPGYTPSAGGMSTRRRPRFESGIRHGILMLIQRSRAAHSVDRRLSHTCALLDSRGQNHNSVYTSMYVISPLS